MQMSTSHTKVERLLAEVVTVKTKGAATAARPGQLQLACDIMDRLDAARNGAPAAETQLAGEAPTGVGKSFALLAAAFVDADNHGRRTVISTQQKVLQNQIVTIDAPDMKAAAANLGLKDVGVEVLKGWRSYRCPQRTAETASVLTGGEGSWADFRASTEDQSAATEELVVGGVTYHRTAVEHALDWAYGDDRGEDSRDYGDMADFRPLETGTQKSGAPYGDPANLITTSREDCLAADCPFWEECPARASRQRAEAADIVVTNHALLGIQAALGVPTVFGNKLLGDFDNLMVDEAHDLTDEVRTRGAQVFKAETLGRAARLIEMFADEAEEANTEIGETELSGQEAAAATIAELRAIAGSLADQAHDVDEAFLDFIFPARDKAAILPCDLKMPGKVSYDNGSTMDAVAAVILPDLEFAATALRRTFEEGDAAVQRSASTESRRWRAVSACESLAGAMARFTAKETPRIDATWVETRASDGRLHGEGHVAPLNVAGRIRSRLWRNQADNSPRASIAVSATMPDNFVRSCGMNSAVETREYESPYASAYKDTAVYIPKVTEEEILRLTLPPAEEGGRPSFNHNEHPYWASEKISGLIRANRGAALVLSATRGAGEHYAKHLRRRFRGLNVLDQWSSNKEDAIKAWKDDESAVLVGTRSLMTGVDAHGPTNSLVILDKISRSPEEPLLRALVQYLAAGMTWEDAIAEVYVVPGANLLKQSGGRLIRRETDGGMFAVLDPRFHKANEAIPGYFSDGAKAIHKRAIRSFGKRIFDYDDALDFLEDRSGSRPDLSAFAGRPAA